ncbi:hypothetical protein ACWGJX_47455, partial [Streptomyces sp. NPDC054775]
MTIDTSSPAPASTADFVPLASKRGHRLIAATALGSGIVFLDGSVVNVALPAISADVGGGFSTLQWVLGRVLSCDHWVVRVRSLTQIIEARRWRPAR